MMEFKKICIIHLNQIGDLAFSLPLLRALRENYPESKIHSILRPHLQELLLDSPYVDQIIYRKSGIKNQVNLLKKLRQNKYDLLITLSNSVECLFLATFSGARFKVGFASFPWDMSLDIKEKVEGHFCWYNNLKLLKRLRVDVNKKDYVGLLVLPPEKDCGGLGETNVFNFQGKYVIISAGTSAHRRVKAWEESKFGDLIILLKERYDLNPVLVGSEGDKALNEKIIRMIKAKGRGEKVDPILNLAGRIGLKDLCYLLKDASLFVGVDSGIMHLASSFDIPVVGIFGPSDPFYVGPQNARSILVREDMECVPCYLKGCEDRKCMKKLGVEKVFNACEKLLNQ